MYKRIKKSKDLIGGGRDLLHLGFRSLGVQGFFFRFEGLGFCRFNLPPESHTRLIRSNASAFSRKGIPQRSRGTAGVGNITLGCTFAL